MRMDTIEAQRKFELALGVAINQAKRDGLTHATLVGMLRLILMQVELRCVDRIRQIFAENEGRRP